MVVSETVMAWLLEGDPAIRWQVRRDLTDEPESSWRLDRKRIASEGWGARLLGHQDAVGTWAGGLYGPKWTSTTYTLLLLYRLGLEGDHPAARAGVARLWEGARYFDGGLTAAVTIGLPEACITGMYVLLASHFGYRDPRVDDAVDWLLGQQLADGGWNCQSVRTGSRHGSFHTTVTALEALSLRPNMPSSTDRGREFLLRHELFKSHRSGEVVDRAMLRLSFPPRWRYDVLRALDHFRAVGAPVDARMTDALAEVEKRRRRDGTWPLQQRHAGRAWFEMETVGEPSRWNTLRALRVLRWAGRQV